MKTPLLVALVLQASATLAADPFSTVCRLPVEDAAPTVTLAQEGLALRATLVVPAGETSGNTYKADCVENGNGTADYSCSFATSPDSGYTVRWSPKARATATLLQSSPNARYAPQTLQCYPRLERAGRPLPYGDDGLIAPPAPESRWKALVDDVLAHGHEGTIHGAPFGLPTQTPGKLVYELDAAKGLFHVFGVYGDNTSLVFAPKGVLLGDATIQPGVGVSGTSFLTDLDGDLIGAYRGVQDMGGNMVPGSVKALDLNSPDTKAFFEAAKSFWFDWLSRR